MMLKTQTMLNFTFGLKQALDFLLICLGLLVLQVRLRSF